MSFCFSSLRIFQESPPRFSPPCVLSAFITMPLTRIYKPSLLLCLLMLLAHCLDPQHDDNTQSVLACRHTLNDQSSTLHLPSVMLQLTCQRHPRRPYCRQQAPRLTLCARLTLQRTSSLGCPQDPPCFCLILTFGRPSFADHPHAFFSSGDYSTALIGRLHHGLTFGRLLSQPAPFLWRFIFVR